MLRKLLISKLISVLVVMINYVGSCVSVGMVNVLGIVLDYCIKFENR